MKMAATSRQESGEWLPSLRGWLDHLNFFGRHGRSLACEPDHGVQPWLQVLLCHLANVNTFGIINSFGVFQPFYVAQLPSHPSPSTVSWIGSLQIFFVYSLGAVSGRTVDAGYFHLTLGIGLLMQIAGMLATSFCKELWQIFLAQGLCVGIGNGLVFCPVLALVSTWFGPRRRALALSIVASGGGTGGLIFPAVAQNLLYSIGLGWTVRTMALLMLLNATLVLLFTKTRPVQQNHSHHPLIDYKAFRETPYLLYTIGIFFTLWGTFFAFYYIRAFARDILSTSEYTSFSLLLTINGAGIPGRILPAVLSTLYLGPLNTLIPCILLASLLLYTWTAVHNLASLYIFASIFGFWGAAIQALFPAAISSLTSNDGGGDSAGETKTIGARIGMVFTVVSPACLSGPPIAGALIQLLGGRYWGAQVFGGTVMLVGGIVVGVARINRTGKRSVWVRI